MDLKIFECVNFNEFVCLTQLCTYVLVVINSELGGAYFVGEVTLLN